jgi:hypothetical protein
VPSFIFQAVLSRYDLPTQLIPGKTVGWIASKYRSEMSRDDVVYFWLGGPPEIRGIYGWGVIVANTPRRDDESMYRIDVEYKCRFEKGRKATHISSSILQEDSILRDHVLFRMPLGTNFMLSEEESEALRKIVVRELGEDFAPPATH